MKAMITACLFLFCGPQLQAQDSAWTIRQVSKNVYVFETRGTLYDIVQGNCTVIEGDKELMVVDNFNDVYLTGKALEEIRRRSGKPVRYMVNTHWHYDHVMGNALVKKQFPGALIVAHSFTAQQLTQRVDGYIKNLPARLGRISGTYDTAIRTGRINDTIVVGDYERSTRYPRSLQQFKTHLAHMNEDYRYVPVDLAFTDSLKISMGNEEVILLQPGSANTKGDIIVYLPAQQILVTGDIVVHPIPYAFGADQFSWIRVLEKLRDMDVKYYIPGHGQVQSDKNYIQTLIDVFSDVNREAEAAIRNGLTVEQAKKQIRLPAWEEKLAGSYPEMKWAFSNYFLQPAIQSIYNSRK